MEEARIMIITLLVIFIMIGLIMPLFWIIGTTGSIIYILIEKLTSPSETFVMGPELGVTMADGGEKIKKEVNE